MNKTKLSCELKANAKENLLGHYNIAIPALLMISIFSLLVNNLSTSIYSKEGSAISFLLNLVFSIISAWLLEVFSIGKASLFLNIMTNREAKLNDIYHGFKIEPKLSLKLCGIYILLLGITGYLPIYLFGNFFQQDAPIELLVLLSLLLISGLIFSIYIILSLSQIFYLVNDFPSVSAMDTIRYSYKIMKDHRVRLFYIHISFIPWYLLSILTFGIALLWVIPYLQSTLALFYLDLIDKQQKNGKH